MQAEGEPLTRKQFLAALAAPVLATQLANGASAPRKEAGRLLIVVAHPDDEYAFAGGAYRLIRELGWTAEQVVITDGEAGYRYSALAEAIYGKPLANERDGRANLPAIRKEEARRAGKILGISRYHFLDQKDLGFSNDAAKANTGNWDCVRILESLKEILASQLYDAVLTLLPTAETHAHHRAAAALALEAIASLPEDRRPVCLGVEPRSRADAPLRFGGREPALVFDRTAAFGYRNALNYQVVVNWVIAEHKSQGLFQMDCGKHDREEFWVLSAGRDGGLVDEWKTDFAALRR